MKRDVWKWINRIFLSGIWIQPFVFAGLEVFLKKILNGDISTFLLFWLSFLPSVYVWSENQRQRSAGKRDFGIEDVFHDRPTQYSSPLKLQAMYPRVDGRLLFDTPQGVVLGRVEDGVFRKRQRYLCKPMENGAYRDGHVLVIGGSGSGKSSAVIIPTLLATEHTGMFCIDIKGELWRKSRRLDDENTVIIDFQDRSSFGWDALKTLNGKNPVCDQDIRECMEEIANSLIPISAKDASEFWKQSARSLLIGELVGLYKQRGIRNLSELINEILSGDTKKLIGELMDGARPKATEVKLLSSFKNLAEETLTGIIQQQEEALKVFIDEDIRYGFEVNRNQAAPGLLEEGKAIFLSIREEKLEAYYNIINLMIAQVFGALIKRPEGSAPVLVVIDELARLCARGQIPYLHNGILLTGRSRNITLLLVTQSYEALQTAYTKEDIQSMVANCAYLVCLDVRSQETAKSICAMAGTYRERETTWSGSGKNRSVSISYREKPVLEPSDLAKLVQAEEAVLISSEFFYCRVKKCSYFKDVVLGEKSAAVQNYNRAAMELEGKETPAVRMTPHREPWDAREILLASVLYGKEITIKKWKKGRQLLERKAAAWMKKKKENRGGNNNGKNNDKRRYP